VISFKTTSSINSSFVSSKSLTDALVSASKVSSNLSKLNRRISKGSYNDFAGLGEVIEISSEGWTQT